MKSEPVLLTMSTLAGLQLLVGAAAFGEIVPTPWAGLAIAAVAAVQAGMAVYVRGKVSPVSSE